MIVKGVLKIDVGKLNKGFNVSSKVLLILLKSNVLKSDTNLIEKANNNSIVEKEIVIVSKLKLVLVKVDFGI